MSTRRLSSSTEQPSVQPLSIARSFYHLIIAMAFVCTFAAATPSAAEWEDSKAEEVTAKIVDAMFIRPLAAARVAVGGAFMIPASIFAAPGGQEGLDAAYEILLVAPIEYAFERDLGDF